MRQPTLRLYGVFLFACGVAKLAPAGEPAAAIVCVGRSQTDTDADEAESMSADAADETDPAAQLPAELRAELDELVALADAVEPVVADLAARYHQLSRWDHVWPTDPAEPAALDARVLAASGDDRLRAVLTSVAVRAVAALEGVPTRSGELSRHGLDGFGLGE